MTPDQQLHRSLTRRHLFKDTLTGVGTAALASMLGREGFAAGAPGETATEEAGRALGLPELPHFAPKAKRVIYLFQNGAPSHVDLFDHKPKLAEKHGEPFPEDLTNGVRFSTMTQNKAKLCLGTVSEFDRFGESGMELSSSHIPYTAALADKICLVRSMHTTQVNHAPAITFFLSGAEQPGRPSMGAWLSYGLGSETEDLPSFVCMTSISDGASCGQIFYDHYWGSGFLPSIYQGVKFRAQGDPVLYLQNPDGMSRDVRRGLLDDLAVLNQRQHDALGDPEILARIAQYEMAYRMQASVPELTDFSDEPASIREMYGPGIEKKGSYGYNCLMARRLAERGTRFIQLMHAGWDQHNSLTTEFPIQCRDTDQPSAALVKDLEQRGMLDETLVIWGGEFGRTPFLQNDIKEVKRWGRDHHPYAFSLWMAGGGIKPGVVHGATDEYGFNVTEDPVHPHDLQATILHQMGIDHERLTYRYQGRRFRLTDVHGRILTELLA